MKKTLPPLWRYLIAAFFYSSDRLFPSLAYLLRRRAMLICFLLAGLGSHVLAARESPAHSGASGNSATPIASTAGGRHSAPDNNPFFCDASMTVVDIINPATCGDRGGILFKAVSNIPDGVYTFYYKKAKEFPDGQVVDLTTQMTVSGGDFNLQDLEPTFFYYGFQIEVNGCISDEILGGHFVEAAASVPTIAPLHFAHPTSCSSGNITFTATGLPDGIYPLNFNINGNGDQKNVSVSNGSFVLSELVEGAYTDFFIAHSACSTEVINTSVTLSLPTFPTLTIGTPEWFSCGDLLRSVPFSTTGMADGNYLLDYVIDGSSKQVWVEISNGAFKVSDLRMGQYTSFSICTAVDNNGLTLSQAGCSRPFITTWRTTLSDQQITIPGTGTNYTIYWEKADDVSVNGTVIGNDETHFTLPVPGDYRVSILAGKGTFTRINFGSSWWDRESIHSIDSWGDIIWSSMESAFEGCHNLTNAATDIPDLQNVTTLSKMFSSASKFNGDLNGWDVSRVTDMSSMFSSATAFNSDLSSWDVRNVTNLSSIFRYASAFNQSLETWTIASTQLGEFLDYSGMSCENYSKSLMAWARNPNTSPGSYFSAWGKSFGPAAQAGREVLINKGWYIMDNGLDANCTFPVPPILEVSSVLVDCADGGKITFNTDYIDDGNYVLSYSFNGTVRTSDISVTQKIFVLNLPESGTYSDFSITVAGLIGVDESSVLLASPLPSSSIIPDTPLNPVNCGDPGRIPFTTTGIAAGTYTMSYTLDGIAGTAEVNIKDGAFVFSSVAMGQFANFAICSVLNNSSVTLSDAGCVRPFITTWQSTRDSQWISIPGVGANYSIVWEKTDNASVRGTMTGNNTTTIILPEAGTYRISIKPGDGTFTQIKFGSMWSGKEYIRSIDQWGDISWSSMESAFQGCDELKCAATDVPDLRNVSNMAGMFSSAYRFNGDLSGWDVSQVTNMSDMFTLCSVFNSDLSRWDVSKVTDMSYMFVNASVFNSDMSGWDVSNVTNMTSMFRSAFAFNGDLSGWDVSKVKSMSGMFEWATSFNHSLANWKISTTSLSAMMDYAGLSCENYSKTLMGWAANPDIYRNVYFSARALVSGPASEAAREVLRNKGWTIADSGVNVNCLFALPPSLTLVLSISPDACSEKGRISFSTTDVPDGTYEFRYRFFGNEATADVDVVSGQFSFSEIPDGEYSDFSILVNGVSAASNGEARIINAICPTVYSIGSGNWSDPSIWWDGVAPSVGSNVVILFGRSIRLDGSVTVAELTVNGQLIGNGTINAIVINNNGVINPGNTPGCIEINGDLTSRGTFVVEVYGMEVCNDYDQLSVSGMTALSGVLDVYIDNAYIPAQGDVITFLDAAAFEGTFDDVSSLPENWYVRYNYPDKGQVSLFYSLTPMPVELISFKGNIRDDGAALLEWETASEKENKGFYVEKSADATTWQALGFVPGQGSKTGLQRYSFVDDRFGRAAYYRLRQVDIDGTTSFSNLISLRGASTGLYEIVAYPNPASRTVKLTGLGYHIERVTLQVFDITGKRHISLLDRPLSPDGIEVGHLESGSYLIEVTWDSGRSVTRFVKD